MWKNQKKVFRDFLSQKSWWKSMKVRNFEKSYWSWKLMIFYFFSFLRHFDAFNTCYASDSTCVGKPWPWRTFSIPNTMRKNQKKVFRDFLSQKIFEKKNFQKKIFRFFLKIQKFPNFFSKSSKKFSKSPMTLIFLSRHPLNLIVWLRKKSGLYVSLKNLFSKKLTHPPHGGGQHLQCNFGGVWRDLYRNSCLTLTEFL